MSDRNFKKEFKNVFSTERLRDFHSMKNYAWKKAESLVEEYRRVLRADNGDFRRDVSLLPASKDKITKALAVYYSCPPDEKKASIQQDVQRMFKEYFSLYFFGERMEYCDQEHNVLFDFRKFCSGNTDAIQKIESIHREDENLRNHYLEGEKSGHFERIANATREGLVDQFGALCEYPNPIILHLNEFTDKKWPDDLATDWIKASENYLSSKGQPSGCLSLIVIAAIPTAIYVISQFTT
ncbi:hypothetical protein OAL62_00700 [bacterium]|nr:hypothetical protein [Akkermansiaceae bacterium]MDB4302479.1 hypothetical protein [bacterium]MDB4804323.1 hypothetical protein [Akkermansiaceae bacterium]MDC0314894.1 hypothetical protein [bacterium]